MQNSPKLSMIQQVWGTIPGIRYTSAGLQRQNFGFNWTQHITSNHTYFDFRAQWLHLPALRLLDECSCIANVHIRNTNFSGSESTQRWQYFQAGLICVLLNHVARASLNQKMRIREEIKFMRAMRSRSQNPVCHLCICETMRTKLLCVILKWSNIKTTKTKRGSFAWQALIANQTKLSSTFSSFYTKILRKTHDRKLLCLFSWESGI